MREYKIKYVLDDAAARQATQRSLSDLQAIERQAQKTATAVQNAHGGRGGGGGGGSGGGGGGGSSPQARAANDLDALQDRLLLKDYKRRVDYERNQIVSAERAASRAVSAEARKASQLDAIQDRYIANDYKRRVEFERKKLADAEKAAEESASRQTQLITAGLAVAGAVGMKGLQVLIDGYEKVREDAMAAAEATLTLKRNLKEQKTLGGDASTEETLAKTIKFRAQTGLDARKATEFIQEYEGSVNVATEKFEKSGGKEGMSKDVAEQLKVQAGARLQRAGGDPRTAATMAGLLGMFGPVKSVESGLGQLEVMRDIMVKGRGSDSELNSQLLNVSGAMVDDEGPVPSLPEMAAIVSTMSLAGGPNQAGNRTQQLYRGLMIGMTKHTKVKGTDTSQGDYLQGLGIKEGDTLEGAIGKISPDLEKAEKSGRSLDLYLAEKNFRDQSTRRAVIEAYRNREFLTARLEEAKSTGAIDQLGEAEIEKNKAYLATDEGRAAIKDVLKDARDITQGSPALRYKTLYEATELSPEFQKEEQDQGRLGKDFLRGFVDNPFDATGAGRRNRVNARLVGNLRGKADALGIDPALYDKLDPMGVVGPQGPRAMEEFVNRVESLIEKAGGSNAIDTRPVLESMDKTLKELRDKFPDSGGKTRAPVVLQAAPPRANQRPN